MNDQTIEQEIKAKGLTAPRVTPHDIKANIVGEHYFTAAEGTYGVAREVIPSTPSLCLLTFCVLELRNGFTVTGESACASPENFDAEIGRLIARDNAVQKIWPLMGYQLREQLYQAQQPAQPVMRDGTPADPAKFGVVAIDADSDIPPHQQRVITEKAELDAKATALSNFIGLNPVFATLDPAEQERLKEQCEVMHQYREILGARIAAF